MEDFFGLLGNWLFTNYPIIFVIFVCCIISLYIIKQIKEIFLDKGGEEESLGIKLKYFFFFWLKRSKKINKDNVIYSDENRKKMIEELKKNNLFQQINIMMNTSIPFMNFGSQRKNEVLRDVIKIYIEILRDGILSVINNYQLDKMNTEELNNLFSDVIEKTSDRIYSKIRTKLGEPLYNLIIEDPKRGFKAQNSILRDVLIESVLIMSAQHMSVYNHDNYDRALVILSMIYISLKRIVTNFEKVFKEFNGELNKYL